MCGIAGVINLKDPIPIDDAALPLMLGMIRHRGPDEFGIYQDAWASLGSARLSIIDLSGGQQPIQNEDGTLWIVFNGEIYNYIELRRALEARGHRFATNTDTEVILHLYEDYGPACLHELNGQFTIAIWDTEERLLFLARDRLGIRPLFYTISSNQLVFGSEIKSILAYPDIHAEIDRQSLAQVFTFWSIQSPRSIFRDISTLPPGHYMLVRDGNVSINPYWKLDYALEPSDSRSDLDYLEEFEDLLIDATLIRLRADVPVGAYLSGGLDSSTTTAIVRKYAQNQLKTFSVSFSDPEFDESDFQQQMADFLGTDHQVVHCTQADIGQVFSEVVWHIETPVLRTAPAPMFLLSEIVHEDNLKVVITGEGADEVLGGYDIFKEMAVRRFWAKNPDSELRPLLLKRLYQDIGQLGKTSDAFRKAFFKKGLTQTESPFYSHAIRWSNTSRIQRFLLSPLNKDGWLDNEFVPIPSIFQEWSPLARAQYLEIVSFLSPYLLSSQGDRVSMAHSVEGRYPFLDFRIVEFCNRLPANVKLRGLTEKWLLRQFGRKLLPKRIWQRGKRPYRAPIQHSFLGQSVPEYARELLSEAAVNDSGLFETQAVMQLVRKAKSGSRLGEVDEMALVGILSMQLVYDLFIKSFSSRLTALKSYDRLKVVTAGVEDGKSDRF